MPKTPSHTIAGPRCAGAGTGWVPRTLVTAGEVAEDPVRMFAKLAAPGLCAGG
jgi:hypothetical protein